MGALIGLALGVGLLLIWRSGSRRGVSRPTRNGWSQRRTLLLRQAGVAGVDSNQLLALQLGSGVAAFVVTLLVTATVSISACFALFGVAAPVVLVSRLRRRRTTELRELWPEIVDNLTSAVRAGLSLPEALSSLGIRGPEQLRGPFARFGSRYRASGRFMYCLDLLKDDLADPVADRICETLRVAREVGGTDLGRVLRTLSTFLREDARTRAELETRQGWTVNAARLAVAAPWAVLLLLATQQTTLEAYDSTTGASLLVGGGLMCAVAYRLMMRIGRLPEERRVLA
ncbi:MAG: type II secretion system F family protein [Geodermatophilaceae bacterium]|nr:type II secretion system F family protein [Geodermatophilaceae bacterium]